MPKYKVIAEFVDTISGRRLLPGDEIEATTERVEALKRARVIGAEIPAAPSSYSVTCTDDSGQTVTEQIEAASYQEAVDKVINGLFTEPEEVPPKPTTKAAAKKKAGK